MLQHFPSACEEKPVRVGCQVAIIYAVINDYLKDVPVKDVQEYEQKLFTYLEDAHRALLERIERGEFSDADIEELREALNAVRR